MSTFIKDFIEREKVSRRNFMFATAAGLTSAATGCWDPRLRLRVIMAVLRWHGVT